MFITLPRSYIDETVTKISVDGPVVNNKMRYNELHSNLRFTSNYRTEEG